ncbi:MarR family winged helix-turn-helix transcriptional regulator [Pseudacidovorax intermedius]|uniref:MarR family transcriptional regulator n=1 Tax=Pseudacidovorax intermedius TaxID=433924 RepID=A0A147GZG0_9BURK|nr:MarR family transcriptional regulator [Pseudacidovorax intermedius]KTT22944.1 MarR family transcriptional regulator [Pseudacidovorax intermedius]
MSKSETNAAGTSSGPPPADFYKPETYTAEESLGYTMKRILACVSQAVEGELVEPGGPTYPQWVPLHKLHASSARTVAELARECQLDTGAMTRLLDRLEAKDLVRRVRSQEDRRVVNLELTPEGMSAAQKVPAVLSRIHNEVLAGFSEAEWKQLKSYLQRILENAQRKQAACSRAAGQGVSR